MDSDFIQYIKHSPFIRLVIPLILGIIFSLNIPVDTAILAFLTGLSIAAYLITGSFNIANNYKRRYIKGIIIYIIIFLLGIIITELNDTPTGRYTEKKVRAIGVITEALSEKDKTYKSVLKLKLINSDSTFIPSDDKLITYFEKSPEILKLKYGDLIIFEAYIQNIENKGNPYEFDYAGFLNRKGISGHVYLKDKALKVIKNDQGNLILSSSYKIKDHIKGIYKEKNIQNRDLAVLQALTLGDKSEIDPETKQSFSVSGGMHILAVSGLHVGILFLLFNFCLKFTDRIKYKDNEIGKHIRTIIVITLLWGFALISGLSPSVCRAALMFTFIAIGQSLNRKPDIYNSLAASAFVLLVADPYQITNVGFQLSYCAVLSIVFFQPRIANLFVIKNKVLWYIWSLTAVSIAAQIGTFPFSLYYFNIFPNYFLLTNILVIPMATLILYFAVLLILTSLIPYISDFFALILKYLVKGLNFSAELIESLPFSYAQNITYKGTDVFIAYLFILSVTSLILFKSSRNITASLSILVIWIFSGFTDDISFKNKKELIVYNINNETAINIICEKNYLLGKSSLNDSVKIKYGPKNYFVRKNLKDYQFINTSLKNYKDDHLFKKGNFLQSGNQKIILIDENIKFKKISEEKFEVDYIIISDNVKPDLEQISNIFKFKKLIFDSSNDFYYLKDMELQCEYLNIPYHSIKKHGAFTVEML